MFGNSLEVLGKLLEVLLAKRSNKMTRWEP